VWQELQRLRRAVAKNGANLTGTPPATVRGMGHGARRFHELRAWQACDAYKKAVYRLCLDIPMANDWKRRGQLEDSVAGPPGHVAEGFGRFNPSDFARFLVFARSSLMESQNHLRDAVDKKYISEETRLTLDALAEVALEEVTGLMEYLQSPEASRNARRARERRIASRNERIENRAARAPRGAKRRTENQEQRTHEPNQEPEHEPRSENEEE
jgi:four helix bundle protein